MCFKYNIRSEDIVNIINARTRIESIEDLGVDLWFSHEYVISADLKLDIIRKYRKLESEVFRNNTI